MDIELMAKIVFVCGIINIIALVLVFFSCRCILPNKLGRYLIQKQWYQRFYKTHGWYWWLFFVSVLIHAVLALVVYGNPF